MRSAEKDEEEAKEEKNEEKETREEGTANQHPPQTNIAPKLASCDTQLIYQSRVSTPPSLYTLPCSQRRPFAYLWDFESFKSNLGKNSFIIKLVSLCVR